MMIKYDLVIVMFQNVRIGERVVPSPAQRLIIRRVKYVRTRPIVELLATRPDGYDGFMDLIKRASAIGASGI